MWTSFEKLTSFFTFFFACLGGTSVASGTFYFLIAALLFNFCISRIVSQFFLSASILSTSFSF